MFKAKLFLFPLNVGNDVVCDRLFFEVSVMLIIGFPPG